MKNTLQRFHLMGVFALALLQSPLSHAHGRWILPSHFNMTGDKPHTITVDMSISNELFVPDHGFIPLAPNKDQSKGPPPASLNMIEPNAHVQAHLSFQFFKRKSVGVISLKENGTHHIYLEQAPVKYQRFTHPNGKQGRVWGFDRPAPKEAQDLAFVTLYSTINTYVSHNAITPIKRLNKGLELVSETHMNDLFVGESTQFQVLFNGNPLEQAMELNVVRGQTRYRNDREVQKIKTDDQGAFTILWKDSGIYLVESEQEMPPEKGNKVIKHALYTTLEVNPE